MMPSVVTLRMRLSPVSAMYTLPDLSTQTPLGRRSSPLMARPPSLNVLPPPGLTRAGAGEGVDHARGVDDADAVIDRIGDIQIARRIQRDSLRPVQLRLQRRSAIAGISGARIAGDHGEIPAAVDLEHVVAGAEVGIALRIDGDAVRLPDGGARRPRPAWRVARPQRQWLTYIAAPTPKSCLPAARFRTAFQPVSTFTLPFLSGCLKDE